MQKYSQILDILKFKKIIYETIFCVKCVFCLNVFSLLSMLCTLWNYKLDGFAIIFLHMYCVFKNILDDLWCFITSCEIICICGLHVCVVTTSTICFWSLQVVSKLFFCSSCVHLCNTWNFLFLFLFVQWMKCKKKKVMFFMQYMLLFHIKDHFFKNKSYFFVLQIWIFIVWT